MKIYGINNTFQFKGTEKQASDKPKKNGARRFATIEDLVIKNKPEVVLSEAQEIKIINHMKKFAEQRTLDEYKAVESAKKIILSTCLR